MIVRKKAGAATMLLLPLCLLVTSLTLATPRRAEDETEEEEQVDDLPPLLDSDDIAYFFETNDIDSLHWALKTVFDRSQRNPDASAAPPLPEQLVARGGGSTYTTAYKLQHDLEQALYLARQTSTR